MSWITLANSLFGVNKPVKFDLLMALRDNIEAVATGATGAPVNTAVWHPHDRVTIGDSATGRFYNFGVDGALTSVVTPDFVDGFEYQIVFNNVTWTSTSDMTLELYRETTGSYSSASSWLGTSTSTGHSGFITLPMVRASRLHQLVNTDMYMTNLAAEVSAKAIVMPSAQKITKARLALGGASALSAGSLYLFRRAAQYGG